ncbi:lysine decarboxylase family protein [Medicago truncatula]|uniref:Lysine decarboxylase family protein n=1 Tax=Medicago truncatula TaxID=3880 RepID=G7IZQ3_MEDTR|nr:lysine decarboxylase family protein [Medicago truncatula]
MDLVWHKQVPLKVSIFALRLIRDRLPTRTNLIARRVLLPDMSSYVAGCVGEVKVVADMHKRNAETARHSDAFIALPGKINLMNVASSIVFHEWTVKRSLKSYRIIAAFLTVLEKFSNVVIGWPRGGRGGGPALLNRGAGKKSLFKAVTTVTGGGFTFSWRAVRGGFTFSSRAVTGGFTFSSRAVTTVIGGFAIAPRVVPEIHGVFYTRPFASTSLSTSSFELGLTSVSTYLIIYHIILKI